MPNTNHTIPVGDDLSISSLNGYVVVVVIFFAIQYNELLKVAWAF